MNTNTLFNKLLDLYQQLKEKNVISNSFELNNNDYYSLLDYLLVELKKTYPKTRFKKVMKSVHYANGFKDERLKEAAFKLDEIEQLLSLNKFIDHDNSVKYFNEQIIKREINQFTLTETMIESLMNS